MKVQSLSLKNVTRVRQFFAPLNRWVPSMGVVDVLEMCEGRSEIALSIASQYKDKVEWQIFEIFAGAPPLPEGTIENVSAPNVFDKVDESKGNQKELVAQPSGKLVRSNKKVKPVQPSHAEGAIRDPLS